MEKIPKSLVNCQNVCPVQRDIKRLITKLENEANAGDTTVNASAKYIARHPSNEDSTPFGQLLANSQHDLEVNNNQTRMQLAGGAYELSEVAAAIAGACMRNIYPIPDNGGPVPDCLSVYPIGKDPKVYTE